MNAAASIDSAEIARFARLAEEWWDPSGKMKPLHRMNPCRMGFIRDNVLLHFGRDGVGMRPFTGLAMLDVGCGGGLLCEPLARLGGTVTGIDPARESIDVARRHAEDGGLTIDYRATTLEEVVAADERFDVVAALEVVEHVVDMPAFVALCARALKPGGLLLVSTINRTLRSFALAIVGAEYVLRWLPVGTHDWEKFVRPEELAKALEIAGCATIEEAGMLYDPLSKTWRLGRDTAVNYIVAAASRTEV